MMDSSEANELVEDVFDDVSIHDFQFPALTAMDRCDRCSAAAKHRAVLFDENDEVLGMLLFCGHHGRKSEDGLLEQGFWIW